MSADEILVFLTKHSMDALPQALIYIVNDCARPRTDVVVDAPNTVMTVAAEEEAARLLSEPGLKNLGLRKIDSRTLVSSAAPHVVARLLLELGFPTDMTRLNVNAQSSTYALASSSWGGTHSLPSAIGVATALTRMTTESGSPTHESADFSGTWSVLEPSKLRDWMAEAAAAESSLYVEVSDGSGSDRVMHISPIHIDSGFATVYDIVERKVSTVSLSRVMRASREA
jgi:hypothetical protein